MKSLPGILADLLVLFHFFFVLFVTFGGIFILKSPKVVFFHLPALLWGILIEFSGWICPLTPLENLLRRMGGEAGYEGAFIEHYIIPILYPAELTRELQIGFGVALIAVNGLFYGLLIARIRRIKKGRGDT